jgi:hypothetical protein
VDNKKAEASVRRRLAAKNDNLSLLLFRDDGKPSRFFSGFPVLSFHTPP